MPSPLSKRTSGGAIYPPAEIRRVLKPSGTLLIVAEIYKGANTTTAKLAEKYIPISGMQLLTPEEHRTLLSDAGYSNIQVVNLPDKGWIFAIAQIAAHLPSGALPTPCLSLLSVP